MRFIGLAQILGKTLLLLVPLWIVCFIGSSYTEYRSGWNDLWTAGVAWLLIPLVLILPTFIALRLWASIDSIRSQHQGKAYADVHDWMTFSRTQWKKFKHGYVVMEVFQTPDYPTYILHIKVNDHVVASDTFEAPRYAMTFADYIWENKLSHLERIMPYDVQQGWSQSRAIALR